MRRASSMVKHRPSASPVCRLRDRIAFSFCSHLVGEYGSSSQAAKLAVLVLDEAVAAGAHCGRPRFRRGAAPALRLLPGAVPLTALPCQALIALE